MNSSYRLRVWLFGILVVFLLCTPTGFVQAQVVPHLIVNLSGQTLTAGFDNNVTVTVLNSYYTAIYDVDVGLAIPSGLTMYGDSHWHYDSLQLGQSVTINFRVYAPTAGIGASYQGSVTVSYKQLGDVSYTQEVHSVSFSVQGWINLILYGIQLTPSVSSPGGNTTVSGNLLNSGNLAAFNANVTVESDIMAQSSLSSAFLGEIDPNIPRPFSLLVVFKSNVPVGNYSLVVKATAIDSGRPASPYSVQATANLDLRRASAFPNQRGGGAGGVIGILLQILRYLEAAFFGSASPFSFGPQFSASTMFLVWLVSNSSRSFLGMNLAHSYFRAATAFILEARHAG